LAIERSCPSKLQKKLSKEDAMICGPNLYLPTKKKKLSALTIYQEILPFILPLQPEYQFSHLWHNDLHDENIFVHPENPTKTTGISDWQSTQIAPLYDQRSGTQFPRILWPRA
jgi:Phosphotransferase enzyme family